MDGLNAFKISLIGKNLNDLQGKILTIIDASVEGDKNKAIKDLIKREFSDKHDWFYELSYVEQLADDEGKIPRNEYEDGLVPFESGKKYYFK